MFELFAQLVMHGQSPDCAIAAHRCHRVEDDTVEFERTWLASESSELTMLGDDTWTGSGATISAVASELGVLWQAMR